MAARILERNHNHAEQEYEVHKIIIPGLEPLSLSSFSS